jgi:hypothetical protein
MATLPYQSLAAGTPLFVRPDYVDSSWVPEAIDYGMLVDGGLWHERFANRD